MNRRYSRRSRQTGMPIKQLHENESLSSLWDLAHYTRQSYPGISTR